ncbi:hypothetical protein [Sphingobium sp.]|uniref:hypothetical protein n=1 Tax=Sphingobium sp. TaxID=1912891 RepID=UPI0028BD4C3B|nr:hypothetical protein [Sphingobium sp.]
MGLERHLAGQRHRGQYCDEAEPALEIETRFGEDRAGGLNVDLMLGVGTHGYEAANLTRPETEAPRDFPQLRLHSTVGAVAVQADRARLEAGDKPRAEFFEMGCVWRDDGAPLRP